MKRFLKIIYYPALIGLIIFILYGVEVSNFIGRLANSEEGILLGFYKKISQYFVDSEAWNHIFLLLFISFSIVLVVGTDIILKILFKWLSKKYPKLQFLGSNWFNLTIQKVITITFCLFLFITVTNVMVIYYGNTHTANSPNDIPDNSAVLILGTSKKLSNGKGDNLYYTYRINAAEQLWRNNKVEYFIISGDRSGDHYDETRDIKNDLMGLGVPAEKIKLDTAGFRTLDSMLRIRGLYLAADKEVETRNLVVISQKFHVQRAVFLAFFYGMKTVGYNAAGTSTTAMVVRELFGKPKVILDLIFFNMMPKVKLDSESMEYREEFAISTDLHIILIILISLTFFSAIGIMIKYID